MAKSSGVVQPLKKASAGSLFPSETDAPFEPLEWPGERGRCSQRPAANKARSRACPAR
jgi:hypothetical protein